MNLCYDKKVNHYSNTTLFKQLRMGQRGHILPTYHILTSDRHILIQGLPNAQYHEQVGPNTLLFFVNQNLTDTLSPT